MSWLFCLMRTLSNYERRIERIDQARAYRACQLPLARKLAQNLVPKVGTRPIFTLVPIFGTRVQNCYDSPRESLHGALHKALHGALHKCLEKVFLSQQSCQFLRKILRLSFLSSGEGGFFPIAFRCGLVHYTFHCRARRFCALVEQCSGLLEVVKSVCRCYEFGTNQRATISKDRFSFLARVPKTGPTAIWHAR